MSSAVLQYSCQQDTTSTSGSEVEVVSHPPKPILKHVDPGSRFACTFFSVRTEVASLAGVPERPEQDTIRQA